MPANRWPRRCSAGPSSFPEAEVTVCNCPWFNHRCTTDRYDHHESDRITVVVGGQACEFFIAKHEGHPSEIWLVTGAVWQPLLAQDVGRYADALPVVREALLELATMLGRTWE